MRQRTISLSLILAIACSAFAQQPQQPANESAPSLERLRAHVSFLASDKLEGRRTGSSGANAAARYIAGEFARYGLRRSIGRDLPGMSITEADSPRRYMQEFPYVAGVELGKNNALALKLNAGTATPLVAGQDWLPLGFSSNSRIEGAAAVFVNYGIAASELKHDDYAGVDAKDKVVVALDGTPDGDNPHGQFARYADPRWKALAAKDRGAKALVLLSQAEKFTDDKLSALRYDNAGEAGLPVIVIGKAAAYRLLQSIYSISQSTRCSAGTKLADGTIITPCGDIKVIQSPGGKVEVEFPDGKRTPLGPDGTIKVEKFIGPKELEKFSWSLTTEIVRRNAPAYNVIGILDGSDPVLKNEVIVIGAHYDHLGRGGSASLATRAGDIHHGADDNASGVAGVLELARIFSTQRARMKRTLVFAAFSGEEEGLLGSNYYVNHPIVPLGQTVAMINLDMVGRMKEKRLMIGGVGTAQEWREMLAAANLAGSMNVAALDKGDARTQSGGVNVQTKSVPVVVGANGQAVVNFDPAKQFNLTLNEDGYGPSDHSSFYAKQVPVLFFFTGTHDDYHKPSDTAEKINYEDEARILAFVASIVRSVDAGASRPVYTTAKSSAQGRSVGFRVYLGTIPNYSESNDGLKLDGVREDSPASKAGLKAGDRITRLAGREVRNVYDYTYALGEMKAEQEYEVEVVRGSETLKLKITPMARK
jgi:aminopeptidase YwaD